jgi:hypothetical protein
MRGAGSSRGSTLLRGVGRDNARTAGAHHPEDTIKILSITSAYVPLFCRNHHPLILDINIDHKPRQRLASLFYFILNQLGMRSSNFIATGVEYRRQF